MCWFSLVTESSRAVEGQECVTSFAHNLQMLSDPTTKKGVCMRDGDLGQFHNFPQHLQEQYAVGPDPIVVFRQEGIFSDLKPRDRKDIVDFQNGNKADFQSLPSGLHLRVIELEGQPKLKNGGTERTFSAAGASAANTPAPQPVAGTEQVMVRKR